MTQSSRVKGLQPSVYNKSWKVTIYYSFRRVLLDPVSHINMDLIVLQNEPNFEWGAIKTYCSDKCALWGYAFQQPRRKFKWFPCHEGL